MGQQPELNLDQVCTILQKHEYDGQQLIPILQEVQEIYKYLPKEAIEFIAKKIHVPAAKIYGVATFYAHFCLEPKGKYLIKVCDGTACHVKKSIPVLNAIRERLNLAPGKSTTNDMLFTVETVSCLGTCGLAPAIVINDKVHGLMTPESACACIDEIIKQEASQ
ncbi:MAG: NAD(P)H-dependent oxidoreductase subunit E [Candidatus Riflebacteria bacterium]|mgnify:CR=1 FL=1|nr:NAD(P)H-dependent oxidoreductase subunit E [Candidatus Riflebacteria bacterium]